jgi:hypothetical protein
MDTLPMEIDLDQEETNKNNIFRYKLTEEAMEALYRFAKVHQYDARDDFKEAWTKWTETHLDLVELETRRLSNLGYHGDVTQKMFKSARYYFRTKTTEKKEPVQRKGYIGCSRRLLVAMETHIEAGMNAIGSFKPSDGFDDFCRQNVELLKEEMATLGQANNGEVGEVEQKIKKTYKNRYFRVMTNK